MTGSCFPRIPVLLCLFTTGESYKQDPGLQSTFSRIYERITSSMSPFISGKKLSCKCEKVAVCCIKVGCRHAELGRSEVIFLTTVLVGGKRDLGR